MKKILVAIDFSESCENALAYTKELVKDQDTRIDMIHVYNIPITSLTKMSADVVQDVIAENKRNVENMLTDVMQQFPKNNQGKIFPVYGNYASSDIVDKANQINADLIIMALRQKYSMIDRFIGTVTAHTISKTSIPVLAIPNGSTFSNSCNILLPTEQPYAKVLTDSIAANLARLFDYCDLFKTSNIYMVHINNGEGMDIEYKYKPLADVNFIVSNALSMDEGIKKILEKKEIELIAIEKSSRSFWERLYQSNITRKLLFKARLPILIFTP